VAPLKLAQKGVNLVELAVAMALIAVMGIAVANLMTATTLTQINNRLQSMCEQVASSVVERLRWDLRFASAVAVANAGQQITITYADKPGNFVRYRFANNTLTRTDQTNATYNFATAVYNDPNHPLRVFCQAPCFRATALGGAASAQVGLYNLIVRDNSPIGTALDAANNGLTDPVTGLSYNRTQFRIQQATFNVLAGQRFQ
jgi:Flp pilus assembly pilin Flp